MPSLGNILSNTSNPCNFVLFRTPGMLTFAICCNCHARIIRVDDCATRPLETFFNRTVDDFWNLIHSTTRIVVYILTIWITSSCWSDHHSEITKKLLWMKSFDARVTSYVRTERHHNQFSSIMDSTVVLNVSCSYKKSIFKIEYPTSNFVFASMYAIALFFLVCA